MGDSSINCYRKRDPPDENDGYRLNEFSYDEEKDVYECPQRQILAPKKHNLQKDGI
ncbi:MAG: hypothetical protein LBU04_07520 [Christensenellaceae bacterium]|nr:hypothetical protein [Christensenellaceae bacterium]